MSKTSLQRDPAADSLPTFKGAEFSDLGRRLALCRLPCDMPSWERLSDGSTLSTRQLLQRADIWRLRTMLAHEEAFVFRLDDHRVRTAVAQLVDRGVLGLFQRAEAAVDQALVGALPLPAALAPPARPTEAPPRAATGRARPATAPAPAAAIARDDAPAPKFDQVAQAAVLTAAASFGTPFCEECARRAAAQEESVTA